MDITLEQKTDHGFLQEVLSESTGDYYFVGDLEKDVFSVSQNMADDFGFSDKLVIGLLPAWMNLIQPEDRERYLKAANEIISGRKDRLNEEYQVRLKSGELIWIHEIIRVRKNAETGKPESVVGIARRVENGGKVDLVTGLYTHEKYMERVRQLEDSHTTGIMLLGIDDFTSINTLNNHSFGDLVLRNVAQDIRNMLPESALICRFDGDQFIIVYPDASRDKLEGFYETIQEYTSRVYKSNGIHYQFTISAGAVVYPDERGQGDDLLKCAAVALKNAKLNGKDKCVFYSPGMLSLQLDEQRKIQILGESIRSGFQGFSVVYQPVNDANTLKVCGAEALLRFENEACGALSPAEFIPLLETSNQIIPVGRWVLEQAIAACKKWTVYIPDFVMQVNVSYLQLRDKFFCTRLEELLRDNRLSPKHIVLELTESYFITDSERINDTLKRLRQLNIRLAMDDFGTGYSSLGRLTDFDVDIVKIDRLFVKSSNSNRYNRDFIESVIRLCHNVGMKVCIEGVETGAELDMVNRLYADTIQGFYVSRPVSDEHFFNAFVSRPFDGSPLLVHKDKAATIKKMLGDKELLQLLADATPLCLNLWNQDFENIICNKEAVKLFGLRNENEYLERFFELSPEFQPNGERSDQMAHAKIKEALETGRSVFRWMHCKLDGTEIPAEITLVRVDYQDGFIVAGYTRDIRQQLAAENAEQKNTRLTQTIIDAMPLCVNLWNRNGFENILCNKKAVELFNLKNEQEYLDRFFDLSPEFQPDGRRSADVARERIAEAFEKGKCVFNWMHCDLTGNHMPAEITLVRMEYEHEDVVVGFTRDLREQVAAENVRKTEHERIRALLDAMPLSCMLWGKDLQLIASNQEAVRMFAVENESDILSRYDEFSPVYQPEGGLSRELMRHKIRQAFSEERTVFRWTFCNQYGEPIPCEVTLVRVAYQGKDAIAAYCRDLRELVETIEQNTDLKQLAYYDSLTGTSSRVAFMESLKTRFRQLKKNDILALVMMDFDNFKTINDTYGHQAGDATLQRKISQIRSLLPQGTQIGRYGGDEFIILMENVSWEDVNTLMKKIVEKVSGTAMNAGGFVFPVTISAGGVFWDSSCLNCEQLLNRADNALYDAKRNGRNRFVLMDRRRRTPEEMASLLRHDKNMLL